MLRIFFANHKHPVLAANGLAIFANWFDRGMDFHFFLVYPERPFGEVLSRGIPARFECEAVGRVITKLFISELTD